MLKGYVRRGTPPRPQTTKVSAQDPMQDLMDRRALPARGISFETQWRLQVQKVVFGSTGESVSRLGVGLSEIRGAGVEGAKQVLNAALDAGVNFLDTSQCYGDSEDLVGAAVSHRRSEFFLATKAGHATGDSGSPWTYETVARSIDRSLKRLRTDRLDLIQLHSCGVDVLERGDVIRALQEAQQAGKTRFIGYSGDNEAARWAVDSKLFASLQTSFNLVDQRAYTTQTIVAAHAQGMGVIAKRPIANAVWGVARKHGASGSVTGYGAQYFERACKMAEMGPISGEPKDAVEMALGFVFAHEAVNVAIVGTRNADHMKSNLALVNRGVSVSPHVVDELHQRFEKLGASWVQLG